MMIMSATRLAMLSMCVLWPLGRVIAAEVETAPVEIQVLGRVPGPPLWRVYNGENVLWIFPYVRWVPQNMIWESARVERVIAESQEVLGLPEWSWGPSALVQLNPVNRVRWHRLLQEVEHYPRGVTLEENLSPELFARFAALQARYFPDNNYYVDARPLDAGRRMVTFILRREGLDSGDEILGEIQRFARRNRDIRRTEISVGVSIGSFNELKDRAKAVYASLPPEQELACLEEQIGHMEEDLDEMRRRTSAWAEGNIARFRNAPLWEFNDSEACNGLFFGNASPEAETLVGMVGQLDQMWLDAAENALATNASTFAVLPINELVTEGSLLSKLKAKGYEVREP
jgi:hypothetical protein